ncbi:MAG: hypothetical protein KC708_24305, partial [Anaerolineae bacterium]|nr:hypothetical protein [Anaerolineae bacterium]
GLWEGLPPVFIGRGGYDSALLAHCLSHQIPIIDGTFSVVALHQFHDYSHVPGGLDEVMRGDVAKQNRLQHQIRFSAPTIADAYYALIDGRLLSNNARGDRLRALELQHRFVRGRQTVGLLTRLLWRFSVAAGIQVIPVVTLSDVIDAWLETVDCLR